jgi:hypothetical protein
LRSTLPAADARIRADRIRVLPAEFAEPVVVNAEMVGDLVMTVRRTWSSTSCSVRQIAQIAGR